MSNKPDLELADKLDAIVEQHATSALPQAGPRVCLQLLLTARTLSDEETDDLRSLLAQSVSERSSDGLNAVLSKYVSRKRKLEHAGDNGRNYAAAMLFAAAAASSGDINEDYVFEIGKAGLSLGLTASEILAAVTTALKQIPSR